MSKSAALKLMSWPRAQGLVLGQRGFLRCRTMLGGNAYAPNFPGTVSTAHMCVHCRRQGSDCTSSNMVSPHVRCASSMTVQILHSHVYRSKRSTGSQFDVRDSFT